MAVRVPDTNTFSLVDVYNAVNDHANPAGELADCYTKSLPTYFDYNYHQDGYAEPNSLKRFRNYGPPSNVIFVPEGFSPNSDGVHDYFEIENLSYYPYHKMSIFNSNGDLMYSRENLYDNYPWDGKYNGNNAPTGTYTWVLEIAGAVYDSGFVMLAR